MYRSNHARRGSTNARTIVLVAFAAVVSIAAVIAWHAIRESLFQRRERALASLSINNLKQISLAIIQQEQQARKELISKNLNRMPNAAMDAELIKKLHYQLPPAICRADGTPLLSWRVAVLPYIDDALYKRFHLDEAWDSPNNKELIADIPQIYCSPGRPNDGKTLYLVCVGEETPFPAHSIPATAGLLWNPGRIRVFEADEEQAVPWTQPADLVLRPGEAIHGVGHSRGVGFPAATGDGAAFFIRSTAPPDQLRQLFTSEGGRLDEQYRGYPE